MNILRRLFSHKTPHMSRRDYVAIGIISIVYAVIAGLCIASQSSYFDEGFTSYLARFSPLDIAYYTALDVHPPLYYILLHFWQEIVGFNVFLLRSMSIGWGVIAIVFGFLIAFRLFGRRAAYVASFFMIMSPLFIRYSEAMRMYTMALALITIGTYILVRLIPSSQPVKHPRRWWVAYAVVVSAAMWTNYFTALFWAAHLLWLAYEYRVDRKRFAPVFKSWWRAVLVAIALYVPWLPWLVVRFTDIQASGFWIKPISIDTLMSNLTTGIVYHSSAQTTNWLVIGIVIYIAGASCAILHTYKRIDARRRPAVRLLIASAALPIILLILVSLPPFRSSYVFRYALNGTFILTLLVGCSVAFASTSMRRKSGYYGFLVIACLTLGYGVITAKQAGNRNLDTGGLTMVSQAVATVNKQGNPGEPIIALSPYTYYTAALYETPAHPVYYRLDPAVRNVGSVKMLYDHAEKRGINDLKHFGTSHPKIWLVSEDRYSSVAPASLHWKRIRSIILKDPQTGRPAAFLTEYATQ